MCGMRRQCTFPGRLCRDPSILPLAIEAIEKYGWEGAFPVPPEIERLPLSEESLPWVLNRFRQNELLKDGTMLGRGWRAALASYLWAADANLLARHHSEFLGIKGPDNDDLDLMEMRVDLLTVEVDTCWEELELLCLSRGPRVLVRLRGCRTRAPIHSRRRTYRQNLRGFAVGFDRGYNADGSRIARKGTMASGSRERSRAEREKQIRFYAEPPDETRKMSHPPPPKRKIGRNDPRPCGSGKKFKKCCIKEIRIA